MKAILTNQSKDHGRWTDIASSFRVKINPANDGVRLRKRINQLVYHQETEVIIDGTPAGTWFEKGSNYAVFHEESLGLEPSADYHPDWGLHHQSIPRYGIRDSSGTDKRQIRTARDPQNNWFESGC